MSATDDRARQLRGYADHLAAVAEFHRQRAADEQARTNALISEAIAVLAGELLGERYASECPQCTRALGSRNRTCPHCHPHTLRSAA